MKTRIIVAAVGLPLLLVVLLVLPPVATAILVGAMSVIAVYELMYQTGLAAISISWSSPGVMALAVSLWSCGGCEWTPGAGGNLGLSDCHGGGDAGLPHGTEI